MSYTDLTVTCLLPCVKGKFFAVCLAKKRKTKTKKRYSQYGSLAKSTFSVLIPISILIYRVAFRDGWYIYVFFMFFASLFCLAFVQRESIRWRLGCRSLVIAGRKLCSLLLCGLLAPHAHSWPTLKKKDYKNATATTLCFH